MTDADREQLRLLAGARLAELRALDDRARDARATVALDQQSVGRLSRVDALQRQAMARATETRRKRDIERLSAALERMDDPEYGTCDECGGAIAPERLRFDPAITRCVDCVKAR